MEARMVSPEKTAAGLTLEVLKSCCADAYSGEWARLLLGDAVHPGGVAQELARVLRPGSVLGLSDLTRTAAVPAELHGLLAWIACIADALPLAEYVHILADAGLAVTLTEPHDEALAQLVRDVRAKLMGAELLGRLKQIELPGADFG